MTATFHKFPHTPHLAVLPGVTIRGDKVFTPEERESFLSQELVVEEKVDGANLGISFNADGDLLLQNRGAYLHPPFLGQWKKLDAWLEPRLESIFEHLGDQYILFGEWCYAKHSILYTRLPDWFLGFDIFLKAEQTFVSVKHRAALLEVMGLAGVPVLAQGLFTLHELTSLLSQSRLADAPAEGLYLRHERGGHLIDRAKLVRSGFVQGMEQHWTRTGLQTNSLQPGMVHYSSSTPTGP